MAEKDIHVALATDNNYVQHLGGAVRSMMEHTDPSRIIAHVVCQNVEPKNIDLIRQVFSKYPTATVHIYDFDATDYGHFRVDGHISLASYIRLFLADTLPLAVDTLVYLDSDLCVLADIAELASTNLDGAVIAAAPDIYAEENARLGLPAEYDYFNAGILVIDLAAWRRLDLSAKALRYVETNAARLTYHDQDALNALLYDRVKKFDIAWNYPAKLRRKDMWPPGADRALFTRLSRIKPKIIHYTTHCKPWFFWADIPFEREYLKSLRFTPWANFKQPDKKWNSILLRYVSRFSRSAIRPLIPLGAYLKIRDTFRPMIMRMIAVARRA
jgi:lipopolysaccharide biosynthesis glycosyltransferase